MKKQAIITDLVKGKTPTTLEKVFERLSHVINPETGIDIVKPKLIDSISIDNGIITIALKSNGSSQFSDNIKEEIKERLQYLWDISEVRIIFDK